LSVLPLACGDGGSSGGTRKNDAAAVYSAIVGQVLADEPITTPTDGSGDDPESTSTTARTSAATTDPSSDSTIAAGEGRDDEDDEDDERELPTVYVEPLGDGYVIDLGTQAGVVKNMESIAVIRFIDHRAEAIDKKEAGEPVREGGMLLGLGPLVEASTSERTVQVRRYLTKSRHRDLVATVTASGEAWAVKLVDAP
jgi:hypothetical protein